MTEREKFMGRLEEAKLQAKSLKLKAEGLRDSVRDHLDPFEEVFDLKLDVVATQALELAELQIQHKAVSEKIKALEKSLGK